MGAQTGFVTNDVSAQVLLAFLNDAWQRAADEANSIRETLVADHAQSLQPIKYGSLASVGKNSTSQSYKPYGPATLTQVQVVEAIGNLLGLYDQLKSKLTEEFEDSADFDYAVPAAYDFDPVIYNLLTKLLNAASSGTANMLPDISQLRLPATVLLNPTPLTW